MAPARRPYPPRRTGAGDRERVGALPVVPIILVDSPASTAVTDSLTASQQYGVDTDDGLHCHRRTARCSWSVRWRPPATTTVLTPRLSLAEAEQCARRLGQDANYLCTAFGPTNVAIRRCPLHPGNDGVYATVVGSSVSACRLPTAWSPQPRCSCPSQGSTMTRHQPHPALALLPSLRTRAPQLGPGVRQPGLRPGRSTERAATTRRRSL